MLFAQPRAKAYRLKRAFLVRATRAQGNVLPEKPAGQAVKHTRDRKDEPVVQADQPGIQFPGSISEGTQPEACQKAEAVRVQGALDLEPSRLAALHQFAPDVAAHVSHLSVHRGEKDCECRNIDEEPSPRLQHSKKPGERGAVVFNVLEYVECVGKIELPFDVFERAPR